MKNLVYMLFVCFIAVGMLSADEDTAHVVGTPGSNFARFNPKPALEHPSLPPKILSCYGSYWLAAYPSDINVYIRDILDPMKQAGFTAYDFKLLPQDFDLRDPVQMKKLKELSEEVKKRDMLFMVYLVGDPYHGKRDPVKHSMYPPFVKPDGEQIDKFSLIYWPTWKMMFKNAFTIAALSKELGINAMRLDLETTFNSAISYDDYAWSNFAALHLLENDIKKEKRFDFLHKNNLHDEYEKWFHQQLEFIAKQFEAEIHSINPSLMLGIMPSGNSWFYNAFTKHLATETTPAIIDGWPMYRGEGFSQAVLEEMQRIEQLNSNNIYVPWFRINSYSPEDIAVHAYHTGMSCDGYSNWDTLMLESRSKADPRLNLYRLCETFSSEQYWNAYKKANTHIMDDINSNSKKPSIPYKPVTPLNAPIQPEIAAPAILPAGDGTGESKWFHLRNQQVFHVYVKKDENLQAEIKHNSPHINLSLSWIVLDENKKEIKTGTVLPGKTAELNIELPTGKGYALAVTGGEGAQAWYSVRILTPHNGLVAPLEPITIFNRPNLLLFFRPFEAFNFYVARTEMQEQAIIRTTTMRDNRFLVQLNSQEVVALNETFHDFELPKGTKVNTISINSPETHIKGTFSQNIWVGTKGAVEPYIFDGPERRIKSK